MGKQITRAFRDNLARVARVQLFQHGTPEKDLREGFEFLIVSEAIRQARKAGKL
jgi:hypothetical protein